LKGRGLHQEWYQSEAIINFYRREIKIDIKRRDIRRVSTIPLRRCADPPVANRAMEREMRELCVRLDAMKTTQRRAPDAGDIIEAEME
jgi:hypothetical protein